MGIPFEECGQSTSFIRLANNCAFVEGFLLTLCRAEDYTNERKFFEVLEMPVQTSMLNCEYPGCKKYLPRVPVKRYCDDHAKLLLHIAQNQSRKSGNAQGSVKPTPLPPTAQSKTKQPSTPPSPAPEKPGDASSSNTTPTNAPGGTSAGSRTRSTKRDAIRKKMWDFARRGSKPPQNQFR